VDLLGLDHATADPATGGSWNQPWALTLACGSTPKSRARRPSIPYIAPGSDVGRPPVGLAGDELDGEERRGRKEPRRGRRLGERESAMRLPRKGEGEQRREVRGAEPGMPRTPARK